MVCVYYLWFWQTLVTDDIITDDIRIVNSIIIDNKPVVKEDVL